MKRVRTAAFAALALFAVVSLGFAAKGHAQCATGACPARLVAPASPPGPAGALYRQYGGSGVVYSYSDPVALNAWLAVHDPARPAPAPKPCPKPPDPVKPKPACVACTCGEACKAKADHNIKILDRRTGVKIDTYDLLGNAGLFVSKTYDDSAGLIYQADVGPALVIWAPGDKVPFAITHDRVQLPSKHFEREPRTITWEKLHKAVELIYPPRVE